MKTLIIAAIILATASCAGLTSIGYDPATGNTTITIAPRK